jgi:hypothetical protein
MFALKNILSVAVFVGLHLTAQAAISIGEVAEALGVTEQDVEILRNATDYTSIEVKTWTHIYPHVSDAEADSWNDENKNAFLDSMKEICLHPDEIVYGEASEASSRHSNSDGLESRAVRPDGVTFPSGAQLPPRVPQSLLNAIRNELIRLRDLFLRARGWLHRVLTCRRRSAASCLACKGSASAILVGTELVCGGAAATASVATGGGLTVPAGLTLAGCSTAALGLYGTNIDKCIEGSP